MDEFIFTESDKEWLKNLFSLVNIGGIWGTSWATYCKEDENTVAVIESNLALSKESIEENINRTKIVAEAIGLKFIDKRLWKKV